MCAQPRLCCTVIICYCLASPTYTTDNYKAIGQKDDHIFAIKNNLYNNSKTDYTKSVEKSNHDVSVGKNYDLHTNCMLLSAEQCCLKLAELISVHAKLNDLFLELISVCNVNILNIRYITSSLKYLLFISCSWLLSSRNGHQIYNPTIFS